MNLGQDCRGTRGEVRCASLGEFIDTGVEGYQRESITSASVDAGTASEVAAAASSRNWLSVPGCHPNAPSSLPSVALRGQRLPFSSAMRVAPATMPSRARPVG